ncbi:MAG: AAA family ATPase [Acidobacteria bacterium]|nr:AAA family ATPase [Acidobacteriota bacterium]
MPTSTDLLFEQVRTRLNEDGELPIEAGLLVLAALEGEDALGRALGGDTAGAQERPPVVGETEKAEQRAQDAYLESISAQGFRGIGRESSLTFGPGPGLTLVVGRNGSGKSSFAEALELLLTGDSSRWANRPVVWKNGWKNLHWPGPARIQARFTLAGERQSLEASREWRADEDDLEAGRSALTGSRSGESVLDLGWGPALSAYRPLLPHRELAAIAEGKPSEVYDRMSAALGLDALVEARERLRKRRLAERKLFLAAEKWCKEHLSSVEAIDDERARECSRALRSVQAHQWELDAVSRVLKGAVGSEGEEVIGVLRELSSVREPDAEAVQGAAIRLKQALAEENKVAATDAGRALQLAELLEQAVRWHSDHGDAPCPVCESGELTTRWHRRAEREVERLRREAAAVVEAREELAEAGREARSLLVEPPAVLQRSDLEEIDTGPVQAAWALWRGLGSEADDEELAASLESRHLELAVAAENLRVAATVELDRRQDLWRPAEVLLGDWLPEARRAAEAREVAPRLQSAEKWLEAEADQFRADRFRPIAEQAGGVWAQLRRNSNVALERVRLVGATTQRRLDIGVSVDGKDSPALGVMSQGEINALSLSLFLPRTLLPESPFGFVVIDDPVQAMDPAKVDGLARVLESVAQQRQLIVFTHDERLPESVRRQQIEAHVIEVSRRANSVVECRPIRDPVRQYLDDARALALTDEIPPDAASLAGSTFCRMAIEAACSEVVRRRRIGRGEPHADCEEALVGARTLIQKLALALFDDVERGSDVMPHIDQRLGKREADLVRRVNRGSHQAVPLARLQQMVSDADRLSGQVRRLS